MHFEVGMNFESIPTRLVETKPDAVVSTCGVFIVCYTVFLVDVIYWKRVVA